MAERIGNLIGHLEFTDDQLQRTDKGLKDSGVAMPNFGNVGRELAKEINEEPEEEEERDTSVMGVTSSYEGLEESEETSSSSSTIALSLTSVWTGAVAP